jgi:hypothetical protein
VEKSHKLINVHILIRISHGDHLRNSIPRRFLKGRGEAVCLGDYLFIDPYLAADGSYAHNEPTVAHEYGHSRQSRYFGWLYLLVIGLPSVCNVFSGARYYTVYPENWANKLGGVEVEITGTRSCDYRLKLK